MKRPSPPRSLTAAFHKESLRRPGGLTFINQRRACWLAQFDELGRPCAGKFDAIHILGRQQIRNSPAFYGMDPDLVELAEWDDRNGAPGCAEEHHPRFDGHRGPELLVPATAVFEDTLEFIGEWGLIHVAEQRFGQVVPGQLQGMIDRVLNPRDQPF